MKTNSLLALLFSLSLLSSCGSNSEGEVAVESSAGTSEEKNYFHEDYEFEGDVGDRGACQAAGDCLDDDSSSPPTTPPTTPSSPSFIFTQAPIVLRPIVAMTEDLSIVDLRVENQNSSFPVLRVDVKNTGNLNAVFRLYREFLTCKVDYSAKLNISNCPEREGILYGSDCSGVVRNSNQALVPISSHPYNHSFSLGTGTSTHRFRLYGLSTYASIHLDDISAIRCEINPLRSIKESRGNYLNNKAEL